MGLIVVWSIKCLSLLGFEGSFHEVMCWRCEAGAGTGFLLVNYGFSIGYQMRG